MNVFALHNDPGIAAEYMCDKHIPKMALETNQLLCTAHWVGWSKMLNPPSNLRGKQLKEWLKEHIPHPDLVPPYSMTHMNHPSAVWARQCWGNYNWLVRHGMGLCREYTRRYGKVTKSEEVTRWAGRFPPPVFDNNNPDAPMAMTPFATAMPDQFKVPGDPVQSYRNYYNGSKSRFAKWKYTSPPPWWNPTTLVVQPMVTSIEEDVESLGESEESEELLSVGL